MALWHVQDMRRASSAVSVGDPYSRPSGTVRSVTQRVASSGTQDRYNPVRDRLDEGTVIEDWIPRDPAQINMMFRLIYIRDEIAGPTVDLFSELPWSTVNISGVNDPKPRKLFEDWLSHMDLPQLMPQLTTEYLVIGRNITTLNWNDDLGFWDTAIVQDPDFVKVEPIQIYGVDPKLDMRPDPGMTKFLVSKDPRDISALRKIKNKKFLDQLKKGGYIPLDPLNTVFLPRRSGANDVVGTSFYTRLLTWWALQKPLINASAVGARRKAGGTTHVQLGKENVWEPTPAEMEDIANLFLQAEEDPMGGLVVTRFGVEANRMDGNQSIWKLGDDYSFIAEGKMRALGINEAFLCVTGDTLVPTKERGLIRIDSLRSSRLKDVAKDINISISSARGRVGNATKWYYRGESEVLKVKTKRGYSVKTTPEHKLLVLDDKCRLVWRQAKDLSEGDLLCLNTSPCVRTTKLELNLPDRPVHHRERNTKVLNKPEYMTPDLAFLLGVIVAEGTFDTHRLRISNTDEKLLEKCCLILKRVFDIDAEYQVNPDAVGIEYTINGVKTASTKPPGGIELWCTNLCFWLSSLGLHHNGAYKNTDYPSGCKSASWDKIVPWSILEADGESQLSFLAAYIEGDGRVVPGCSSISFYSRSKKIMHQLQVLLSSHGVLSTWMKKYHRLNLTNSEAAKLYEKIEKYLVSKQTTPTVSDGFRDYGIPTSVLKGLLKDRFIRYETNVGGWFYDDNGEEILVEKAGLYFVNTVRNFKMLRYASFVDGYHDPFLSALGRISASTHDRLCGLIGSGYHFEQVSNIKPLNGKRKLFDLSMSENDTPAFVANGIVIHNSGDANFTTMETALSVLLERIKTLRAYLTHMFLVRKAIVLARAHEFVKRKKVEASGPKTPMIHIARNIEDIPISELMIPSFEWTKKLQPVADENFINILGTMQEKGLPVSLRTWAAAGGLQMNQLLDDMDDDIAIRKRVSEYQKKVQPSGGEGEGDLGGLGMMAAFRGADAQRGVIDKLGVWDRKGEFMGVSARDVHELLRYIKDNPKVLSSSNLLEKKADQITSGDKSKSTALNYVLTRLGIRNAEKLDMRDAKKMATWIKKHSVANTRSTRREAVFLAKMANLGASGSRHKHIQLPEDKSRGRTLLSGYVPSEVRRDMNVA